VRVEEGILRGDERISDQFLLRGIATGAYTVVAGGDFTLQGILNGVVLVEAGGTADVERFR
jgi:hypothetical protein